MEHGRSASGMASRRTMLAVAAVGVTGSVAGCMGGFEEDEDDDDGDGDDESERTGDGTADDAGQDDTGENNGEDDTTDQQNTESRLNLHDIYPQDPEKWPKDLQENTYYGALTLRVVAREDDVLTGISGPGGLLRNEGGPEYESIHEAFNSSLAKFPEDYTHQDFIDDVQSEESAYENVEIEQTENRTIARSEIADIMMADTRLGPMVFYNGEEDVEEWDQIINYINQGGEPPHTSEDANSEEQAKVWDLAENATGTETDNQDHYREVIGRDLTDISGIDFLSRGLTIYFEDGSSTSMDYDEL